MKDRLASYYVCSAVLCCVERLFRHWQRSDCKFWKSDEVILERLDLAQKRPLAQFSLARKGFLFAQWWCSLFSRQFTVWFGFHRSSSHYVRTTGCQTTPKRGLNEGNWQRPVWFPGNVGEHESPAKTNKFDLVAFQLNFFEWQLGMWPWTGWQTNGSRVKKWLNQARPRLPVVVVIVVVVTVVEGVVVGNKASSSRWKKKCHSILCCIKRQLFQLQFSIRLGTFGPIDNECSSLAK